VSAAVVLQGDACSLPLPDDSVDLIVTSPPYFGLRSYTDGGEHYPGQIGSEATPAKYVAALVACTREWMRVLKPSGSLFVNLGDKYAGTYGGTARPKSLLGLPWRYAVACMDKLGLILRAEIIWAKPNGLPESVTDRVRRAHEQVFHFTRQPVYYTAVDEIREPHSPDSFRPSKLTASRGSAGSIRPHQGKPDQAWNPLGRLPGSVWEIASQPFTMRPYLGVDHFAAFPMELPRRIIRGWSPPGGVILDPFGGTGTTALVADALGRIGISVDRSADYCRLARWRAADPGERARAMQVPKPPPVPEGQDSLFGEAV
jgi:DNA modification methylase